MMNHNDPSRPSNVSAEQQAHALGQLREVMNGGDDEVSLGVLESVGWDVERAAEMIFGSGTVDIGASTSSSSSSAQQRSRNEFEEFEMDDYTRNDSRSRGRSLSHGRPTRPQPPPHHLGVGLTILSYPLTLLTYPLHLLTSLIRFVFGVLRIRIHVPRLRLPPAISLNWFFGAWGRSRGGVGAGGLGAGGEGEIERWVRELEEETGARCVKFGFSDDVGESSGVQAFAGNGGEAGPSSLLTARTTYAAESDPSSSSTTPLYPPSSNQKDLPEFTISTYEAFLRLCTSTLTIGCVILVSEEHDDVARFKRDTLTDPGFIDVLRRNGVRVWGGDVRGREAYGAMGKLGVTGLPFVGFVGVQPMRNGAAGGNGNGTAGGGAAGSSLNVLSRHQGYAQTTPDVLITHLEETVLPRVTPYLLRQRNSRRAIEQERKLREAQDRAFEESARLDRERMLERVRKEKEESERKIKEEREKKEKKEREERERKERMIWRRVLRRVGGRPGGEVGGIRVAVRMPDGKRLVKSFRESDTLTSLYALVDSEFIPPDLSPSDDPSHPPSSSATVEPTTLTAFEQTIADLVTRDPAWWGFTLVSAYPRKEIPWVRGRKISEVDLLRNGGGQFVVEIGMGNGREREGKGKGREVEGDGYVTESSDEE